MKYSMTLWVMFWALGCNHADGQCWQRGEGGAGNPSPGPVGAQGVGGLGEEPSGNGGDDRGCDLSNASDGPVECRGQITNCTAPGVSGVFGCIDVSGEGDTNKEATEIARAACETDLSNAHKAAFACSGHNLSCDAIGINETYHHVAKWEIYCEYDIDPSHISSFLYKGVHEWDSKRKTWCNDKSEQNHVMKTEVPQRSGNPNYPNWKCLLVKWEC